MRLVDRFGREVTDLRVSITRRCNFRCVYCHDEGLGDVLPPCAAAGDEMTPAEIERFARIAAEFGIGAVELTGGEPLVRRDIVEIVERAARHATEVSMTTNGSMLRPLAARLRGAGLRRVNVSIDALDPAAFREIRRGHVAPVLDGIEAALAAGLTPVKLNMVVFEKTLPHIRTMIEHVGRRDGLKLQLIQLMPELVGRREWSVDFASLKRDVEARAERVIVRDMHRRRIYMIDGAEVEVVDPVRNREFCMNCRRLRVTHDAQLKGCLNRDDDLIPTRGLDDDGVREAFTRVVARRVPFCGAPA
jgi:cyclic pyranopterin phosphate synthase